MKHLLMFIFAAASLAAADATGTWTGSMIVLQDGSEQNRPARLVLKQDGDKLTGTAGPDATEQHEIADGQVTSDTITFSIPRGETVMKVTLKQEGDEIKGEIAREREGQRQTAKLLLKREK